MEELSRLSPEVTEEIGGLFLPGAYLQEEYRQRAEEIMAKGKSVVVLDLDDMLSGLRRERGGIDTFSYVYDEAWSFVDSLSERYSLVLWTKSSLANLVYRMTYDEEFIEFFKRFELVITGNNDYMLESGYEGDDLEYDHIMMEVYLDEMYAERMGINQVEGWREDYYWDLLWLSEECLPQITFDKDQTVWGRFAGGKTVRKFVGALFPGAVLVDDYLTREDERLAEMFGYTVIRAPRGGEGLMGLVELVDEALK